jgi:hypothetical protein
MTHTQPDGGLVEAREAPTSPNPLVEKAMTRFSKKLAIWTIIVYNIMNW